MGYENEIRKICTRTTRKVGINGFLAFYSSAGKMSKFIRVFCIVYVGMSVCECLSDEMCTQNLQLYIICISENIYI